MFRNRWWLLVVFCLPTIAQSRSALDGGRTSGSTSSSSQSRISSSSSSSSWSPRLNERSMTHNETQLTTFPTHEEKRTHSNHLHNIASPALAVLGERILSKQFLNVALTGVQFGLCFYIARALWKAIVEVMEEFETENQSSGGGGTGVGGLFSLSDDHDMPLLSEECVNIATESLGRGSFSNPNSSISRTNDSSLVDSLADQTTTKDTTSLEDDIKKKKSKNMSPRMRQHSSFASSLAQRLHQSGLPPTSPPRTPEGFRPIKSVQSVLKSLTRTEGRLLSSTLLSPNDNNDDGGVNHNGDGKHQNIVKMWDDIGGLEDVKEGLMDLVFPFMENHHSLCFASSHEQETTNNSGGSYYGGLLDNPPGVLLYGPPGCGKTMLVRALAKTANARFLCVSPSTLFRKYVGETNLNVKALFTLARKISPCIIFIDEMEGLFRERRSSGSEEHEVNRELKTEFMQLWDGIQQGANDGILVIGATNRPFDVDSAFLRRMPRSFFVGLPNDHARKRILTSLLSNVPLDPSFSLDQIVHATHGYTPSDIKEVLRSAALFPLREARADILRRRQAGQDLTQQECASPKLRPLQTQDVMQALAKVSPTPMSNDYRAALLDFASRARGRNMQFQGMNMNNNIDMGMNMNNLHMDMNTMTTNMNTMNQGSSGGDYFVTNNIEPITNSQVDNGFDTYKESGSDDDVDSQDDSYDDDSY